jgi:hypothetical protein
MKIPATPETEVVLEEGAVLIRQWDRGEETCVVFAPEIAHKVAKQMTVLALSIINGESNAS